MRDDISDLRQTEIRWQVLKAMLDNFPELQERTEMYLFAKKSLLQSGYAAGSGPDIKELLRKAIRETRRGV